MEERLVARRDWLRLGLVALGLSLVAAVCLAFLPTVAGQSATSISSAGTVGPPVTEFSSSTSSLVSEQGASVLIPLAIPVAICALALAIGNRWALGAAAWLLTVFTVLGAASIGLFFFPAAVCMWAAAAFRFRTRSA